VTTLLAADEAVRRGAARSRAEEFGWPASVDRMLATLAP
jgi:alpha-1,6-mannosyltransferase